MRYAEDIPPEQLASHASDGMLLFTAVLAIVIGCILIWLGKKGKQMWLVWWSVGLILCSMGMASNAFNLDDSGMIMALICQHASAVTIHSHRFGAQRTILSPDSTLSRFRLAATCWTSLSSSR